MVGVGVRAGSCWRQEDPEDMGAFCMETGAVSISELGLCEREMNPRLEPEN